MNIFSNKFTHLPKFLRIFPDFTGIYSHFPKANSIFFVLKLLGTFFTSSKYFYLGFVVSKFTSEMFLEIFFLVLVVILLGFDLFQIFPDLYFS